MQCRDRAHQTRRSIKIETIRFEFSFCPRTVLWRQIDKRQPPFNAATLDIGLELFEDNLALDQQSICFAHAAAFGSDE